MSNFGGVRTHRIIFPFTLVSMLPGCGVGGHVSEPLVCGPEESASLVFGFQDLDGDSPLGAVVSENGAAYLFVDSACRYWVFQDDFYFTEGNSLFGPGRWADVRTGRLTVEELAEFNRDVLVRPWSSYAEEGPVVPGQYLHAHWYRSDVSACYYQGCSSAALAHEETTRAWLSRLNARGVPFTDLPIRADFIAVFEAFASPVEWTGEAVLAEVARTYAEAQREGGHPLLSEGDSELVRQIREPYRTNVYGTFIDQYVPVTSQGTLYSLYARQTIPYEDAQGLIRAPGVVP